MFEPIILLTGMINTYERRRGSARQPSSCLGRPEGRNRCCEAKVAKTRDALPGHIAEGGCEPEEGSPTRCARTRAAGG
jgi:hypothetical protein